jgi:sortase A
MSTRAGRIAFQTGRAFFMLGLLLLAFVAYRLWGTALYEHHAQDRLRTQLEARLGHPATHVAASNNGGGGDSPTVTGPSPASAAAGAQAPALGAPLGFLSIPKLGLNDSAVVEGTGESQLQEGPGHYPGTALPGQAGNVAIAGHRTTYGAPFYDLDQLQAGDPITLQVPQGIFTYVVMKSVVVDPSDTAVIDPEALPILTLTTCNPRFSAATRLVVVALLQKAQAPPGAVPAPTTTQPPQSPHVVVVAATLPEGARGSVAAAIWWGAIALAAAVALRALYRWLRPRRTRWGAVVLGVPGVLLVLFVCFEHVSLALPGGF